MEDEGETTFSARLDLEAFLMPSTQQINTDSGQGMGNVSVYDPKGTDHKRRLLDRWIFSIQPTIPAYNLEGLSLDFKIQPKQGTSASQKLGPEKGNCDLEIDSATLRVNQPSMDDVLWIERPMFRSDQGGFKAHLTSNDIEMLKTYGEPGNNGVGANCIDMNICLNLKDPNAQHKEQIKDRNVTPYQYVH
jgi:hypothetical protein